jgi:mercuric ion binding protein
MTTRTLLSVLALAVTCGSALAASRTVMLDVQNMSCAVCPITVKKALEHVSGVQQVSIDYASKTATVQFDDTVTTADKLTEAAKAAGYPSSIKKVNE